MMRSDIRLMLRAGAAPTHPAPAGGRIRGDDAATHPWQLAFAPHRAPVA